MADKTTAIRDFLNTRYTTTNTDVTPLVQRYLKENPNALADQTSVMKELYLAVGV